MARRGNPGIITVGPNRHEWSREFWGWRDWEAEDRLQAQLGKLGELGVIPPSGPQPSFRVFPKPRRAASSARSDAVDKLIAKYAGRR